MVDFSKSIGVAPAPEGSASKSVFTGEVDAGTDPTRDTYAAIEEVLGEGDGQIVDLLSSPTLANTGAYLVTAYEVGVAITNGDLAALAGLSEPVVDIVFDVAFEMGLDAADGFLSAIPDMASAVGVMLGVMDVATGIAEAANKKKEAEHKKARRRCDQYVMDHDPFETGVGGTVPADLFVQARREGLTPEGEAIWENTGRIPNIGALLELATEYQWPTETILYMGGKDAHEMFGVSKKAFQLLGGLKTAEQGGLCQSTSILPALHAKHREAYRNLRRGILNQSIPMRQMRGLPPGDGGVSLWPLYMDLLFSDVFRAQWPWGQEDPGSTRKPPLSPGILRFLFGQNDRVPFADQLAPPVPIEGAHEQTFPRVVGRLLRFMEQLPDCEEDWGSRYDRAIQIAGPCKIDAPVTVEQIVKMAEGWGNQVLPIYGPDQARQREAVGRALEMAAVEGQAGSAGLAEAYESGDESEKSNLLMRSAKLGEVLLARLGKQKHGFQLAPTTRRRQVARGTATAGAGVAAALAALRWLK